MLRMLPKYGLIVFFIVLSGCATTYKIGKEFNVTNIDKVKIGVTTQKEIISYFGEPLRRGISNGDEVYVYIREDIIIQTNDLVKREGNTLVIEFDEQGKVKNYYLNIPGKETILFGILFHKREKGKEIQQQVLQY